MEEKVPEAIGNAIASAAAADPNDGAAINALGLLAWHGKGGYDEDHGEAAQLFRRASNLGYAPAQVNTADMTYNGEGGLIVDKGEAARLYSLAAEQGNLVAAVHLAHMLLLGDGVDADPARARALLEDAAGHGDPDACYHLGVMHYHGNAAAGLRAPDKARAARLLRVAANGNDPDAQRALAKMYELGEGGLEMDLEEAEILETAADNDGEFEHEQSFHNKK